MRRRTFLQTSTGALVGSSLLGVGRSTLAAQKPAVRWQPAEDNIGRQATQSITVGDVVATVGSTTVRNPAGGDASSEQIPADVRGIVKVGPRQADRSTWWWVAFESGVSGWVAGSNLGDATVTFLHDQRVATTADLVIHTDHRLAANVEW